MDDKPNPQIISSNNDKPNWFIFYACRNATDVQPRGQTINLFAHPTATSGMNCTVGKTP